ncbi:ribonuclease D [Aurantivibrio infirmus]
MSLTFSWVDSDVALNSCCQLLSQSSHIAVDTEFMRSDTFFPKAALFQLSNGESHFLVDPLAISDFSPLVALFVDPKVVKVLHSCSEDLEVFHYFLQCIPEPLIDTQVAAALLNYGSSLGYAAIVQELLSVELSKEETRSNWLQRPLQEKQKIYAAQDVAFLLPVYEQLLEKLESQKRIDWLLEECSNIVSSAKMPANTDDYYLKIKLAWKLNPRQLGTLQLLSGWRELGARRSDVPRNHFVHEKSLWEIAKLQPSSLDDLSKISELRSKQRQKYGDEILELVQQGTEISDADLPSQLPPPLSSSQKKVLAELKEVVLEKSKAFELPVDMLARKADYEYLIRAKALGSAGSLPPRLAGWRRGIVGSALLSVVEEKLN